MKKRSKYKPGFTMIEILVVIAIIGFLASIILVAYTSTRNKARTAKAQSDLAQITKAISQMGIDTNLWPNGCRLDFILAPAEGMNNEVALNAPEAGLSTPPPVGTTDITAGCDWTASAISNWKGPYTTSRLLDPWGNPYWFDNDYHPLRDCPTANANPNSTTTAVILSLGPDQIPENHPDVYNCDDVYMFLPGTTHP